MPSSPAINLNPNPKLPLTCINRERENVSRSKLRGSYKSLTRPNSHSHRRWLRFDTLLLIRAELPDHIVQVVGKNAH
eukprot:scaffold61109_cov22-Cyclotella_meneghiniana.AAC.3